MIPLPARFIGTARSGTPGRRGTAAVLRATILAAVLCSACSGPSGTEPALPTVTAPAVQEAAPATGPSPPTETTSAAVAETGSATSTNPVQAEETTEITAAAATEPGSTATSVPQTHPAAGPGTTSTRPADAEGTTEVTETAATAGGSPNPGTPALPPIRVLATLPHDSGAFTQGLVVRAGRFYESTGLYGRSTVRIVEPATGKVVSYVALGDGYFGEGLEVVGDRVVQLTWKEEIAFIWDAGTLELLGSYTYEGEGWGLCAFADRFVMSNGSSRLTFRHLETFGVIGGVDVLLDGEPVDRLNELECVGDLVYANVWLSDHIVVIASDSGRVVARVDASPLRGELSSSDGIDVLNGIAYDPDRRVFYLTGKLWPEIFEVRIGAGP